MACPSGLQVLFLLLVIARLLEGHSLAESMLSMSKVCRPAYEECTRRYPPGLYPYPCTQTREERECMDKHWEKISLARDAAERKAKQARNLTINIEQINKDPIIIIHIQVTNKSPMPVTFLNISSPLDPEAFGLGLFHITPDNLPMVNFGGRVLPPRDSSPTNETFVEIGPGMTLYNTVTILAEDPVDKEWWARMLKVADKVEVQMKGKWHGIWATTKDEAMREVKFSKSWFDRDFGSFESNVIELEI
ncbi:hypothetical protein NCS52_00573400 [Fusarium sp. LHS14.1]|nr:hypothetical protein NCS52_00573400 [Fusarium sp. LHS14.1]